MIQYGKGLRLKAHVASFRTIPPEIQRSIEYTFFDSEIIMSMSGHTIPELIYV